MSAALVPTVAPTTCRRRGDILVDLCTKNRRIASGTAPAMEHVACTVTAYVHDCNDGGMNLQVNPDEESVIVLVLQGSLASERLNDERRSYEMTEKVQATQFRGIRDPPPIIYV